MGNDAWISRGLHEHPAKHQAGTFGNVARSAAGIYHFKVGGASMSCPQDWAAGIQAAEEAETKKFLVTLPADAHETLRQISFDKRISINEIVRQAVQEWIEKTKQEEK
jgi:hypothetical protein